VANPDPREEFRRLFQSSGPSLLAQAYLLTGDRQESQDLVQETFLRAWRHWERVSTLDNPHAWLRRVLYNLSLNHWRNLRTRRSRDLLTLTDGASPSSGAERLDVSKALQSLPAKQRQALVLVAIVGMTTAEVAKEMGAKEGTVRVWVSRGRQAMAAALGFDTLTVVEGGRLDE